MALNPSTLLTDVETEIRALLAGRHESYGISSRTVARLRLNDLREFRKELIREINSASGTSGVRVAKFVRTSR